MINTQQTTIKAQFHYVLSGCVFFVRIGCDTSVAITDGNRWFIIDVTGVASQPGFATPKFRDESTQ